VNGVFFYAFGASFFRFFLSSLPFLFSVVPHVLTQGFLEVTQRFFSPPCLGSVPRDHVALQYFFGLSPFSYLFLVVVVGSLSPLYLIPFSLIA